MARELRVSPPSRTRSLRRREPRERGSRRNRGGRARTAPPRSRSRRSATRPDPPWGFAPDDRAPRSRPGGARRPRPRAPGPGVPGAKPIRRRRTGRSVASRSAPMHPEARVLERAQGHEPDWEPGRPAATRSPRRWRGTTASESGGACRRVRTSPATPVASATRTIAPRFCGSSTPSSATSVARGCASHRQQGRQLHLRKRPRFEPDPRGLARRLRLGGELHPLDHAARPPPRERAQLVPLGPWRATADGADRRARRRARKRLANRVESGQDARLRRPPGREWKRGLARDTALSEAPEHIALAAKPRMRARIRARRAACRGPRGSPGRPRCAGGSAARTRDRRPARRAPSRTARRRSPGKRSARALTTSGSSTPPAEVEPREQRVPRRRLLRDLRHARAQPFGALQRDDRCRQLHEQRARARARIRAARPARRPSRPTAAASSASARSMRELARLAQQAHRPRGRERIESDAAAHRREASRPPPAPRGSSARCLRAAARAPSTGRSRTAESSSCARKRSSVVALGEALRDQPARRQRQAHDVVGPHLALPEQHGARAEREERAHDLLDLRLHAVPQIARRQEAELDQEAPERRRRLVDAAPPRAAARR